MDNGRLPATSVTLLGRLAGQPIDDAAWSEFAARYGPRIYGWCRRWQLSNADAEDVTQEVFIKLVRNLRVFRYDAAQSFRGWLKTVTHHAWCDFVASHKLDGQNNGHGRITGLLEMVEASADLTAHLNEEFDRELADEAMARVKLRVQPRTWEVFRLKKIDGRSGVEVARQLTMPVATVYMIAGRVCNLIREEIRKLDGAGHESTSSAGAVRAAAGRKVE